MKKIAIVFFLFLNCALQLAWAGGFRTEKQCQYELEGFDKTLEYLYRFDGNLPRLSDSKKKYLEIVRSKFHPRNVGKMTKDMRIQIYLESQGDPEYFLYEISIEVENLIKKLEKFRTSMKDSDDTFDDLSRKYANSESLAPWGLRSLIGEIGGAYMLGSTVQEFFLEKLPTLIRELERHNMVGKLIRSLGSEDQLEMLMLSRYVMELADCRKRQLWVIF